MGESTALTCERRGGSEGSGTVRSRLSGSCVMPFGCFDQCVQPHEPLSGLLHAASEPDEAGSHDVIRSAAPENDPPWLPFDRRTGQGGMGGCRQATAGHVVRVPPGLAALG